MAWLPLPHADDVTGFIAGVIHGFGHATPETLDQLEVYAGLPVESLFPAPATTPEVERRTRWRVPGLVSEDLVFPSSHEPLEPRFARRYFDEYRENHTVYCRRVRPAGPSRRPRLLYLHGYMQPETYLEEVALLAGLALRLDVEVIQLQPPYHGRRRPEQSRFDGEYYWSADVVRSIEALRQTCLDARSVLSWLREEDDRPVGVAGISLGGSLTCVLTCLDERFDFSVPIIGHMDLARLLADAPVLGRMRRELDGQGFSPRDFDAFLGRIGWHDLVPQLPPERILLLAGSDDRFFAPDAMTDMWRRWGEPEIRWFPCSHMGFFAHAAEVLRTVRSFVDRQADRLERSSELAGQSARGPTGR